MALRRARRARRASGRVNGRRGGIAGADRAGMAMQVIDEQPGVPATWVGQSPALRDRVAGEQPGHRTFSEKTVERAPGDIHDKQATAAGGGPVTSSRTESGRPLAS